MDFNRPPMPPLPQFVSCKTVQAARIVGLPEAGQNTVILLENVGAVHVSPEWVAKHRPQVGWFLVVYQDGYVSAAPPTAMDGYTPAAQWGLSPDQESKYMVNAQGKLANRATGVAIRDDEPVFVLRAQDAMARDTIAFYAERCLTVAQVNAVEAHLQRFEQFAINNPDRVKDAS